MNITNGTGLISGNSNWAQSSTTYYDNLTAAPVYSWATYQPAMEATITIQNKTALSKEEFNRKIQKLITKLQAKFNVKDYDVTF